jgi:tyrosine-protein kinase Etk/Wzc
MSSNEYAQSFLQTVYRRRQLIIIITLSATLASAILSAPFFIVPRYTSEAIIYPPGTNSNRMLIERDARFGSDKEIDEQIQLLRSSIVRDSIIVKYDLYNHYNIDTRASDKRYRLYEKFDDLVKIDRTRYNSIAITVSDVDPGTAAAIANDIISIGDAYKATIIREKLQEAFDALSKTIFDLSFQIDEIATAINKVHNREVVSGSAFNKAMGVDQLREQLQIKDLMKSARETNQINRLEQLYLYESKLQQMATVRLSYDQALISLNNQIPTSFIISPAEIADKKSYPIRWMIVLGTLIASFTGMIAIIFVLEKYHSVTGMLKSKS